MMFITPAVLCFLIAGPIRTADDEPRGMVSAITVAGSGETAARPDTAEIHAGVMTQAPAASEALKANSAAVRKLLDTLSQRGVAEKDVQTAQFHIAPFHRRGPRGEQQPEIAGYRVTNQLRVTIRELDSLGTILDELVTAGANQMHGISFSVADATALLDAARKKAMADARRKAELYAQAGGVKLGRVLRIQEQALDAPRGGFFGMAGGEMEAAVPVAAGENTFHATVTVSYAIE